MMKSISVDGMEILEQHRGRRPEVILANSHFGAARVAGKVVFEIGFPFTKISAGFSAAQTAQIDCNAISTRKLTPFQVIRASCDAIEAGRFLYIAAEGSHGKGGVETSFLGRQRPFRTGFAQLAVKTGAPVVPVFATVDERGVVHVQIHNPLDSGPTDGDKRVRIAALIEQYARLLERYWIEDPGNIREDQFESHRHDYADYRPGLTVISRDRRAA